MSHADEVITDVNRRRVRARAHEDSFTIAWDYPGRTLLEVRILRSTEHPAETADDGLAPGQELVYQDVTGSFRDTGLRSDVPYYYTVFARQPGGEWVRWEEYSLPCEPKTGMSEFGRLWSKAMRNRIVALALGLALAGLTLLAAGLFLPAASASSGGDSGTDGDKQPAAASAASAAAATAEADPSRRRRSRRDRRHRRQDRPRGAASDGQPAGYRIEYHWPRPGQGGQRGLAAAALGLLAAAAALRLRGLPHPRHASVTALQVDVLLDGERVIQAMPVNGETDFTLQEQTWAPFSWVPWFTANPWVLAPVFIAARRPPHGPGVAALARLEPAPALHDPSRPPVHRPPGDPAVPARRLRLAVLRGLVRGHRAHRSTPAPRSAGSLAALPLLLIPPGLFVAALILELSAAPHRGSWALLAVLAGAASAYELASAMTGVTTNLNLTYFILLAVLCLIAIPRAF